MKKPLILLAILAALVSSSFAVPQYITYQGMLRDGSNNLVTGTKSMTFKIYDAETSGTLKYTQGPSNISVSTGAYTVQLGPITATTVFDGSDRWLEIAVEGTTMTPRLKINSIAYAMYTDTASYATLSGTASNAATVDSLHASSTATADQLLALDANKQLKGISVSAEAAGNTYGLFVNSGKLGVKTAGVGTIGDPTIGAAGTQTILNSSGLSYVDVYNSSVTANSLIFLTVGAAAANTHGGLKVTSITAGSRFRVGTMDGNAASTNLPFYYLIIN